MLSSNSGARSISLFVPELLSGLDFLKDIPKQEIPKLPALQLLFTRALKYQDGYDDLYRGVCALSGITEVVQQDLPLAAISICSEQQVVTCQNTDFFIFAEPVVMQADRDSLVLLESLLPEESHHSLSKQESQLLIAEVNLHFSDEPWQLLLSDQGVWYLNLTSKTAITTTNISDVLLKNTQAYIPVGDDARYWRQIITEIEMLFFASEVNAKRIKNNKLALSSLWLWGGGKIPICKSESKVDMICGASKIEQSISQFSQIPFKSSTSNPVNALIHSTEYNNLLLVDSVLKKLWLERDLYSWLDALNVMEQQVFKPILTALRNGHIEYFELFLEKKNKLLITTRKARSWWKPVKKLEALSDLL